MVLQATNTNNVKVYTVSGSSLSRKLPEWLARRKRRELQKDTEWTTRVELIQDFGFPEAALRVKTTADGQFCMATGVYKPQMRVFEFSEMAMKFDRHTDAENVDFHVLSDDWTKSVHLQNDKSVEFHNEGQMHFRAKVPKFGRALAYHSPSCDVLVGGAGSEVFRLNIDQGRFMQPMATAGRGVNAVKVNPAHQLFGFGLEDGGVELWDPRVRTCIGTLPSQEDGAEVSSLAFRADGLGMAVGTSTGQALLYDLRQARPWQSRDQRFGLPVRSLHWLEPVRGGAATDDVSGARILSADSRSIKIWDAQTGRPFTAIEPAAGVNDVCVVPDSGLLLVAAEASEMLAYFVPQLGPAPRWAHFLENLTEEMEETVQQTVYDDYKFVARRELESLGLAHLVGTPLLKPYMHGFFVDLRLYERARAIANPFAYDEYRLRRVQEKLAEARESRIRATTKLPKVNKQLAQRLLQLQRDEKNAEEAAVSARGGKQRKKAKAAAESAKAVLGDDRFKALFANPDFEVDEENPEFKQLHASGVKRVKPESRRADDSSDDDEAVDIRQQPFSARAAMQSDSDDDDDDDDAGYFR
ncbi:Small ribosomal subunit biogenesis [Coemansia sp. Benny D115]|nr:Small ribosomal subunit biogenesis [Coemansia sp. Benny D115]